MIEAFPFIMLIIGYYLGVWTNKIMFEVVFKKYTDEVHKQYIEKLKKIKEV